MALTLRSVLMTAVPALTAILGIFWFSSRRRKKPPIEAPPEQEESVREDSPPKVILTQSSDEGRRVTELVNPQGHMMNIAETEDITENDVGTTTRDDVTSSSAQEFDEEVEEVAEEEIQVEFSSKVTTAAVIEHTPKDDNPTPTDNEPTPLTVETDHVEEIIIQSKTAATFCQSPPEVTSKQTKTDSVSQREVINNNSCEKVSPPQKVGVCEAGDSKLMGDSSKGDGNRGGKKTGDNNARTVLKDLVNTNLETDIKTTTTKNIKDVSVEVNNSDIHTESEKDSGSKSVKCELSASPVDVDSEVGECLQGSESVPSVNLNRKRKLEGDACWGEDEDSASPELAASPVGNGSPSTNGSEGKWSPSTTESETSIDSGIVAQALSPQTNHHIYEFNFPTELCGLLIGARGKNIKQVMDKTGAQIIVKKKVYDPSNQLVSVEGSRTSVDKAMELFRRKFPIKKFPQVDLSPAPPDNPILSSEIMQLGLPEGVGVDVIVSSVVTANHVFVQQPTHPQFPMLEKMNQLMNACYSQEGIVPQLPRPIEVGVICAAPMFNGWYRAQVVLAEGEQDEVDLRFVDYGGYCREPGSALRQIRSDFTTLPFQAVECYLANVIPPKDCDVFPTEANAMLEQLVHGQLVQAHVVGHETDGVPYINLYVYRGNKLELINRQIVELGLGQWVEAF